MTKILASNLKDRGLMQMIIVIICKALLLPACSINNQNEYTISVRKIHDNGIVINRWQILGPIPTSDPDSINYMGTDLLELFGYSETSINIHEFLGIDENSIDSLLLSSLIDFDNRNVFTGNIPLEIVDGKYTDYEEQYGIFYLACNINCKTDMQTMLHVGSSAMNKIWLNGELINFNNYAIHAWSYQNYIPINLNRGDNFLLVKVHKPEKKWELYARLENFSEKGLKKHFESRNHWFLRNPMLSEYYTLELDPVFPPCSGRIKVFDTDRLILLTDSIIENREWSADIAHLEDGYYTAVIQTGDVLLEQGFYKGNLEDTTLALFNAFEGFEKSEKINRNIKALRFRFNHLLEQPWVDGKKIVQIFFELNKSYKLIIDGHDPFHHVPGCFIRSYISTIDESEQYYILHVPDSYKANDPLPVMLIAPTNGGTLPYLESYRVANYLLINTFQDLSNKYNIIVIEPGSRHFDKVMYNDLEETEMFQIIDDVANDYAIDISRLYLSSACSGGNDALKMAVKYPDRFAAIGFVSPSLSFSDYDSNPWLQYNSPLYFIRNIKHMPVLNIHSVIDRHVPFEMSAVFERVAKKAGLKNISFTKLGNEFQYYYTDQNFEDVFDFCRNYSINPSPFNVFFETSHMLYNKSFWITINEIAPNKKAQVKARIRNNKINISTENIMSYSIDLKTLPYDVTKLLRIKENGKVIFRGTPEKNILTFQEQQTDGKLIKNNLIAGPLSHAVSQRFILVKGTTGTEKETDAIAAVADTFNLYWNDRFLVDCILKNDYEISESDIDNANLVLLGNTESNSILKSLIKDLPLSVSENHVVIDKIKIEGNKLCYYMVYPNPLNSKKYIAIVGFNNPDYFQLGSEIHGSFNDVSNYGWYDFKIWGDSWNSSNLLSGYFNSSWE